jgi:hypothetical protein
MIRFGPKARRQVHQFYKNKEIQMNVFYLGVAQSTFKD